MSRAWIERVEPDGLHGFRAGDLKLEELTPGLNLVWAPNASGKSTLAKAIGLLFDPAECDAATQIQGQLGTAEGPQNISAKKKDKRFGGFPGRAADYRLDLPNLLTGFKRGESPLDKEIGSGLRFISAPPTGMHRLKEVESAKEALERLRAARRDKAAVAEIEDDLLRLQQRSNEAAEAGRMAAALETLEKRLVARSELKEKQAALAALLELHPGSDLQTADAVRHAEQLIASHAAAKEAHSKARARLRQIVSDGSRPPRPLAEVDRVALAGYVREVVGSRELIRKLSGIRSTERQKALVARDQLLHLLPDESPDDLPMPEGADFHALAAAAGQADSARQAELQGKAWKTLLEAWREQEPQPSRDPNRRIQQLIAWLGAEHAATIDRRPSLLAGLVVLVGFGLGFVPDLTARVAIGAGAAVVGGLILFLARPGEPVRPELGEVGLEQPTTPLVAEALHEAVKEKLSAAVTSQIEAYSRVSHPEFDWSCIAEGLRLKSVSPYLLAPVAACLQAYLESQARAEAAEHELEGAQTEESEATRKIGLLLGRYCFPLEVGREAGAAEVFPAWFSQAEELDGAQGQVERAEAALLDHFTRNGVPKKELPAGLEVLRGRAESAEACRQIRQRLERLNDELAGLVLDDERLERILGDEVPESVELSRVREMRRDHLQLWEEAEERHQEYADAKAKVEQAEQVSISSHEFAYEAAVSRVEAEWQTLVGKSVLSSIHHAIKERLTKEELPALVQSASDRLDRFTNGRYRLQLGTTQTEGLGLLLVTDRRTGRAQSFDQLSTGTKAHAIIALRLALISDQEMNANGGNIQFPLIADEALAVSDPQAARAIAEALADVARTERQVIVFTHQPQDALLFQRADPNMKLIELGAPLPGPMAVVSTRRAAVRSAKTGEPAEQPLLEI